MNPADEQSTPSARGVSHLAATARPESGCPDSSAAGLPGFPLLATLLLCFRPEPEQGQAAPPSRRNEARVLGFCDTARPLRRFSAGAIPTVGGRIESSTPPTAAESLRLRAWACRRKPSASRAGRADNFSPSPCPRGSDPEASGQTRCRRPRGSPDCSYAGRGSGCLRPYLLLRITGRCAVCRDTRCAVCRSSSLPWLKPSASAEAPSERRFRCCRYRRASSAHFHRCRHPACGPRSY